MQEVNINKVAMTLLLVSFLLSMNSFEAKAQIRSRDIADSMTAALNGVWYNPNYYQFENQYPKLQTAPPLSTGMDFETILAYIYLDSLMRNSNTDMLYMNYLTRWKKDKIKNDTIVQAVKYLYKLIDYNPALFAQYGYNLAVGYGLNIRFVQSSIRELLYNIIGYYKLSSMSLEYMMRADYILKIHVNSIDTLQQRDYPPKKGVLQGKFTHRVNATVIDALKGKAFKNCNDQGIINKNNKVQSFSPRICFTYGTGPYANDVMPFQMDPALLNSAGNLELQPGQDLIVILDHGDYLWDYNYDYFPTTLITVFPVISGQVKDISHIWSNSSSINYDDWKTIFSQKRDMLLNGGY